MELVADEAIHKEVGDVAWDGARSPRWFPASKAPTPRRASSARWRSAARPWPSTSPPQARTRRTVTGWWSFRRAAANGRRDLTASRWTPQSTRFKTPTLARDGRGAQSWKGPSDAVCPKGPRAVPGREQENDPMPSHDSLQTRRDPHRRPEEVRLLQPEGRRGGGSGRDFATTRVDEGAAGKPAAQGGRQVRLPRRSARPGRFRGEPGQGRVRDRLHPPPAC